MAVRDSMPEKALEMLSTKFQTLTWTAFRKGDVFIGNLPGGLGYMIYQQEGNRLMATMGLEQACRWVRPDYNLESTSTEELDTIIKDQSQGCISNILCMFSMV